MTNPFRQHKCPLCGNLTTGTPKEGGITWDICPDCERRQEQARLQVNSHRDETKDQHSAYAGEVSFWPSGPFVTRLS